MDTVPAWVAKYIRTGPFDEFYGSEETQAKILAEYKRFHILPRFSGGRCIGKVFADQIPRDERDPGGRPSDSPGNLLHGAEMESKERAGLVERARVCANKGRTPQRKRVKVPIDGPEAV